MASTSSAGPALWRVGESEVAAGLSGKRPARKVGSRRWCKWGFALVLGVLIAAASGCSRSVLLGSLCLSPDAACSDDMDEGTLDAGTAPALDAALCAEVSSDAVPCACGTAAGQGILAHWPLDDTTGQVASETTGRSAPGVLQNYAGANPWVPGKIAGALSFDGQAQRVLVGSIVGEVKTLSVWLKPSSTQVTTDRTLMQLPSSHGPLDQWTDPQNAYLDDGMLATAASLIGTKMQHWGGFHLARHLPRDAVIQGITVTVHTGNLGVLGAFGVELSADGGQTHTGSRYSWGQLIAGSDLRQAGGADKLWGRAWTADDFTDSNFRVRASFGGIANAMGLDFIGVELQYVQQTTARTVLGLSPATTITFAGIDAKAIATSGWPGSSVFVNGRANGVIGDGWNHLAVVSPVGVVASDVELGDAEPGNLSFPYHGLMDDVALFGNALTADEVARIYASSACF